MRRAATLLVSVLALVVVTFLIVQLIPGDPAISIAGPDASPERVAQIRAELGLDLPVWRQFLDYAAGLLAGDLGDSFSWGVPVSTIIANRIPYTLTLALVSMAVVLVVAIPAGLAVTVLTRGGRRRGLDLAFGAITGLFSAVPGYVTATLLVVVFAIAVPLLPPAYTAGAGWRGLVLPVVALSLGATCTLARVVRRDSAAALELDYIRTARGWRLPAPRIYLRHLLPNVITATLTLSGLLLSGMFAGAVVVEVVFAWPGLGSAVVKAIVSRDYPVIQGIVLVVGVLAMLVNLVVDVLLGTIDPRSLKGRHVDV
ncbi:peptide ABC transporter permease [Microbacterium sp. No. 7]|nr:peptide ABC transporter permease [Microbacterium sp. No. 7]